MSIDRDVTLPFIEKSEPKMSSQYWRPWTLRKPALISFIGLCAGLLLVNELTTFGCSRHGSCHVFGSSTNGHMPTLSTFVYRTVPTILGIALGLRWYVTHYDILRLEPYYQMSTKYGARASGSLFLQYPYEFVITLPFKALLKEHYIVALSSSILFLMNFAIVPLVPTMFDDSLASFSTPGNASLVEFNSTARQVAANFTFSAYDYAWKNGTLAPFMTEEYALLPMKVLDGFPGYLPGENWTVVTTLYEADLECTNARVGYNYSFWPNDTNRVIELFRDGSSEPEFRVCDALALENDNNATYVMETCTDMAAFITPWASLYGVLPDEESYMFGWASGLSSYPNATTNAKSPAPIDITAIFCTPKYYTQAVNISVSMPSGKVDPDSAHRIGKREPMEPLIGFYQNIDGVVNTIASEGEAFFVEKPDRVYVDRVPVRLGYSPDKLVDLKYDLLERFGKADRPARPKSFDTASESDIYMTLTNTLAAFALYDKPKDSPVLEKLLDAKELESSIKKSLKLWFAFAVASESERNSERSTTIQVERRAPQVRITINPYWSLGARIGLPLVVALAVLLTYLVEGRPCHIDSEPSTIAAALKLLSTSPALCAAMQHSEYHPLKRLGEELDTRELYFRMGPNKEGSLQVRVFRGYGEGAVEILEPEDLKVLPPPAPDAQVKKDVEFVSPDLIAKLNLVLFPIIIVALVIVNELSKKYDGFNMPGDSNSFWSKVCFGYLPVAFATGAEALLVILGSTQCMVGPYQALRTKKAKYSESIGADYDSMPPHIQLVQSFKRGQYTLLVLSMTILLSNVLPIFMSSIFSHSPHLPRIKKAHNPLQEIPLARQEMFFQMNRELTSTYSPSWIRDEYYIDSPYVIAPIGVDAVTYQTTGFGVDVRCTLVPDDRINFPCSTSARSRNTTLLPLCEEYETDDNIMEIIRPCGGTEKPITTWWNGTFADYLQIDAGCPDRLFPLWAQNQRYTVDKANRTDEWPWYPEGYEFGTEDKYDFVVLNCSLTDRVADLRATIRSGKVLAVADVVIDETSTPNLARNFISVMKELVKEYGVYGSNTLERINWLMVQVDKNVEQGNETHVPSSATAPETFAIVLERLFPLLLRLNAKEVFGVEYVAQYMEYRAHVAMISFIVALVVLVICFCSIANVYRKHSGRMMGHLPWGLAGMYSQLYASNAKDDVYSSNKAFERVELSRECVYAYGEYPSELGKHFGVYRVGGEAPYPPAVELVI